MNRSLQLLALAFVCTACLDTDAPEPDNSFELNLEAIDDYLSSKNLTAEVDDSGLRYIIYDSGSGPAVEPDEIFFAYLEGRTLNDEVFDQADKAILIRNQILTGLAIGTGLINQGGDIELFMPGAYGFGNQTRVINDITVEANTSIIYRVKILDTDSITNKQFELDLAKIDSFLVTNEIEAQVDSSGLRYVIHEPGEGAMPTLENTLFVSYRGSLLDGFIFDEANSITLPLNGVIEGWQRGLPLISAGGRIDLYIPSSMGYGPLGFPSAGIPSDSPLVFEIELLQVN